MKQAILLIAIALSIQELNAQVYTTGWDTPAEQADWAEWELGVSSTINDWSVGQNPPVSPPNSLAHYYPVGGTNITDDWYVSPVFDFSNSGTLDSLSYKFSGFGTPQTDDTIAIYLLNSSDNPAIATITLLKIFTGADYNNDNVWRKLPSINIPATSGNSYLAFRYKTIVNWLDVQYDNLGITANFNTSVRLTQELNNKITLFPNPATNQFQIILPQYTGINSIKVYDLIGNLIKLNFKGKTIDLSQVSSGTYFVHLETTQGLAVKKILKY